MKNGWKERKVCFLELCIFDILFFSDFSLHRLPILEFSGYTIYYPVAIARFLAKQFGLFGKTAIEEAEIDGILEALISLVTCVRPCIFLFLKRTFRNINLKPFLSEPITGNSVPMIQKYLPILEHYASRKTSHGFLLPSGITFVDFGVTVCYEMIETIFPQVMIPYTNLKALRNRVNKLPQLQEYLKNRPNYII